MALSGCSPEENETIKIPIFQFSLLDAEKQGLFKIAFVVSADS